MAALIVGGMDIQASIKVLQASRPRLTMAELVALEKPVADFEFADHGLWFYTVKEDGYMGPGSLLEGNLMCVRASSPLKAEQIAQEGLRDSIKHFKDYLSTGPQVTAEARPALT